MIIKIKRNRCIVLGTAHSDRYIISNKVKDWCEENSLTTFNYYYMQGRLVYFYKKFLIKHFMILILVN